MSVLFVPHCTRWETLSLIDISFYRLCCLKSAPLLFHPLPDVSNRVDRVLLPLTCSNQTGGKTSVLLIFIRRNPHLGGGTKLEEREGRGKKSAANDKTRSPERKVSGEKSELLRFLHLACKSIQTTEAMPVTANMTVTSANCTTPHYSHSSCSL